MMKISTVNFLDENEIQWLSLQSLIFIIIPMNLPDQTINQPTVCDGEITFQNMANFQVVQDLQAQPETQHQKCSLTRKAKKIIAVCAFILALLTIGLSLGLTIGSRTSFSQTTTPTIAQWENGRTLVYGQFQMQKKKFFLSQSIVPDDQKHKENFPPYRLIIAKQTNQNPTETRLLQQQSSPTESYSAYINFDEMGLSFAVSPDQNIQINVQTQVFKDYVYSQLPEEQQRLLMFTPDPFELDDLQSVKEELNKLFSQQFVTQEPVQLQQTTIVQYVLNEATSKFEVRPQNLTPTRLLTERMLAKKPSKPETKPALRPPIKPSIPQVIKPQIQKAVINVVKQVKKNGKQIAIIAGGLIGGAAGGILGSSVGPAGTIGGAVSGGRVGIIIGEKIGKAAEKVANLALLACVPHDSVTIKCSTETLKQNITDKVSDIKEKVDDVKQATQKTANQIKNGLTGFIRQIVTN